MCQASGELCGCSDTPCLALAAHEDKHLLALCSPFMRRVHEHVAEAGEAVFVDSSTGFGRDNYRLLVLMTGSKAGGELQLLYTEL